MEKYFSQFKKISTEQKIFFWLLVLIIFIPLYPKFPLTMVSGTYVAVRLEDIFIAATLGLFLYVSFKNIKNILSETITQAFLLFWFIGFLSVISAIFITSSVDPHIAFLHWLRRVEVMSLFLVAAHVVSERYQLKSVILAVLFVSLVVVIYGFGQIYFKIPVISTTNSEFSKGQILSLTAGARPNSTFAGHYDLAAYLSVAIVFMTCMWFFYKRIESRILIFLTAGLSFVLLGLTAARVSFAAVLVGLSAAFWLLGKRMLIIGLIFLSVLSVVAIPSLRHRLVATITVNLLGGGGPKYQPSPNTVNSFTPLANNPLLSQEASQAATASDKKSKVVADIAPGEPVNYGELEVYRSYKIRLNVEWPRAIRAFLKNPFLGTGYSSITIATDNDLLRSLGETGILGTLSLGLIFYLIFKRLIRVFRKKESLEKQFIIAIICSLITVLITGTFIDVLEASKIASLLWIFLGISWGVSIEKNNERF